MTENGLAIRDVRVVYEAPDRRTGPTAAVDGVSLDVAPREIVALLGASGSGKSSLLRAVAGLEPLAGGSITWAGLDLAHVPVHRRGFGLMFQDGQLFAHRSVAGNVAYGLAGRTRGADGTSAARLSRSQRTSRVARLLDLVGLAGYGDRPVTALSGGERQRVALARSLAPQPELLLLDEPLSALDRGLRERLALDVRDVLRTTDTTALFVTHDQDEAFTVADRVAVMSAGRLLQVGAPEELWRHPVNREVAEFLGYEAFVEEAGGVLALAPNAFRIVADGAWQGTVTAVAFRKAHTEVRLDVAGLGSVTAHAGPGFEGRPADTVALALDREATARVG